MKYGEVYIITKEFEFDNAFEVLHQRNETIHLKQGKLRNGTKIIKRLRICKEIWMNKE